MNNKYQPASNPPKEEARNQRLQAALRDNLKRRKQAAKPAKKASGESE